MDVTWTVKYITEFIATASSSSLVTVIVANADLKGTKGNNSGWILISIGVMVCSYDASIDVCNVSENHINPAPSVGGIRPLPMGTCCTVYRCSIVRCNVWSIGFIVTVYKPCTL